MTPYGLTLDFESFIFVPLIFFSGFAVKVLATTFFEITVVNGITFYLL